METTSAASPCLCHLPASAIARLTDITRRGEAVPDSLRWQFQRLAYFPFTQMKYLARYGCTIDEYYGITDFQDRDEVKDRAARISHAVLVLKNDFGRIDMELSWTSYKVKSAIRAVKAKAVRPGDVEEPLGTAASSTNECSFAIGPS